MEVVLLQEIPQEGVEQERKRRERQEGLAWPDWQARKRRSWHSRVFLRQGSAFRPLLGKSLEKGTGRRRGCCLPGSVLGSSGLPTEVFGVVRTRHRTASEGGPRTSFHHPGPPYCFFPRAGKIGFVYHPT